MVEKREALLPGTEPGGEKGEDLIPCFRCGECCTGPRIHMTLAELCLISEKLGISRLEFKHKYIDPIYLGESRFLIRKTNGACVFLKHEQGRYKSGCLIHAFRPFSCVSWTPGLFRKQCQAGLAKYWGLTVSSSGQLMGSEERIRDFYLLCSTIKQEESTSDSSRLYND